MDWLIWVYLLVFFFGFFFMFIFLILHYRYKSFLHYVPPLSKEKPLISFLVPAYNEEKTIKKTVTSLIALDYPMNKKEIIIINDGSKDGTLKIARALEKKYSCIKVLDKPNSGKADSLNEAIKMIHGKFMAVVDADSYPKSDALINMLGHFGDTTVGAVTSRVLVKNKKNWLEKFQIMDYSIIAWTRKLLDFVDSVYVTNGPFSLYRTSVVRKIGGFDTKNLTEDIEITWHILSAGYTTRMSYDAIVYTSVPSRLKEWIKQRVRWNLGGLQTIIKYRKDFFKKGVFGYFILPYVSSAFFFAIIGFFLFLRYLWLKGSYQLVSLFYLFRGYNYFKYFEFDFFLSLLLLFGVIFFFISLWYYKIGFKHSETGNQNILKILCYSFIYRPLYVIPLLLAIYKMIRGDIRWYTK